MEVNYQFLKADLIPVIHQTMLEAFSDYQLDMSYMTLERFEKRATIGRVDFSCSVGAFYHDKLVGFTNIGIGNYKGNLAAYDAGTGIIKAFRGQGIAGKMFDFAISRLQGKGVKKFYLEVLQENLPAIKAYKKTGFQVEREYYCYRAEIDQLRIHCPVLPDTEVRPLKLSEFKSFSNLVFQEVAWESNFLALERAPDEMIMLGAFQQGKCIGIISYFPVMEWIMVFGINEQNNNSGIAFLLIEALIKKIKGKVHWIKMGNLTPENPLNNIFQDLKFELYAKQFEMVCIL